MHTPGPWVIDDTTDDYEINIVGHPAWPCTRYGKRGEWDVCKLEKLEGSATEERANARLIAAAPCLLEALRTKRDYVADAASGSLTYADSGDGFIAMAKEDLARIDAAIARATGAGA